MLHLLYILAFTCIAFLAISNLIRSLINLSAETQKFYPSNHSTPKARSGSSDRPKTQQAIHPELLDERGKVIEEPLLVMRSVSVEDTRQRLDALYDSSPSKTNDLED
jgi:hypothetical protein